MLCRVTTLDPDDARPAYRQVADQLRGLIESGGLAPGAQLPTHKVLAEEYGVAVETVKRALALLRDEGLILTRQGKGSYVRRGGGEGSGRSADLSKLAAQVAALNHDLDAIKKRVEALESGSARAKSSR
jgi:DNA-binding GntR family transcriptional regulator